MKHEIFTEEFKKLNYTFKRYIFYTVIFKFKTILYNFDDSLINTVKKVKYQNNDEFMLMKNNKITNDKPRQKENTRSKINIVNTSIIENENKKGNKEFYVEKTDMPDVYNLYNYDSNMNSYDKVDIAYIPNIKTSKFMREIFKDENIK